METASDEGGQPLASRTLGGRNHLSVVREQVAGAEPRRIGPYELIRPVDHLGLPGLWFARREAPPFLAGPSVLLPVDRSLAKLPGVQERVVRAARRAQAIRHPLLVRVEEVVATEDELALVLEAVDGFSLDVLLSCSDSLASGCPADVLLELGARLLEALHDLHGLPHLDGAPGAHGHVSLKTVLFCPDGRVRLIGFGLPTATGTTPIHTQWNARAPTRADQQALHLPGLGDQYAVGLVLLQLATRQRLDDQIPREASLAERASAVEQLLGRLALRATLTPPLLRLLAPNPAHRFADAAEAAAALRHPRGPYAADALEALVRQAVVDGEEVDHAEPDGAPVDRPPPLAQHTAAPEEHTQRSTPAPFEAGLRADAGETQPSSAWDDTSDTEDALPAATAPPDEAQDPLLSNPPPGTEELDITEAPTEPAASSARRAEPLGIGQAILAEGSSDRDASPAPAAAYLDTEPAGSSGPPGSPALDLSRTEASDEAGMAVAVARAWAETDGPLPNRHLDASDISSVHADQQPELSVNSRSDHALDVWTGNYDMGPVSRVVEEDTGALSSEDLEEVASDWFLDEDPSNVELARTVAKAEPTEEADETGRRPVKPGRTVPYSPAFVPKSTAFPFRQPPPALPPGALGLLSAAMPAVKRADAERVLGAPARSLSDPENRTTEPGAEAPTLPPQGGGVHSGDDHTHPFDGQRPTTESVADVAAPSQASADLQAPPSGPDEHGPGPAWVSPSGRPAPPEADDGPPRPVDGRGATGPMSVPGGAPSAPRPRRRRRPPGGRSRRRGATTGLRSLPRLWEDQTIWSSSAVARGVILGVFILLMIGLVEGVRRRLDGPEPERVEAQQDGQADPEAPLE